MKWKGVMPAITTKFTKEDQLDLNLFKVNLDAQLEAGCDGIILGGSLGEASTLTPTEIDQLCLCALDHVKGRVPIVVNIAEQATAKAVEMAQRAQRNGADGLMLLPPMRYSSDERETTAFIAAVASNTDLPIMLYNNPVDYKTEITHEMLDELLKFENIEAIKESTRDLSNITRLKNRFGNRLKIFCGVDTLAMEALLMGADGWVAGLVCAYPRETVAIYKLVKAGRIDEALSIYRWFMPLLELDLHPKLVQYIKLAEACNGIGSEQVRAPRLTLVGSERSRILNVIESANEIRPALPDYQTLKTV